MTAAAIIFVLAAGYLTAGAIAVVCLYEQIVEDVNAMSAHPLPRRLVIGVAMFACALTWPAMFFRRGGGA